MAFVNFSAFLGRPSETHSPHSTPDPQRRHPSSEGSKKKKSPKKIQRDNKRAAKFQDKKRQEKAAASAASGDPPPSTSSQVQEKTRQEQAAESAASGDPPKTSSPAESSVRTDSVNFSFASPVAEDRTHDAMEGISDPQLSPEDLRQQLEDPPSLTLSQNEEIVRDNHSEPILENITIPEEEGLSYAGSIPEDSTTSEEVQQENQVTPFKEEEFSRSDGTSDSPMNMKKLLKMGQKVLKKQEQHNDALREPRVQVFPPARVSRQDATGQLGSDLHADKWNIYHRQFH